MVADFFGASPLPQDRVGFSPSRVGQHSLVLARRVQAGRPHAYPPNCDFGSVRRRARRSAAPDRRGAIEPPAIQSPAILSALLAVATGVAVLRGGRRARYRRNNRHRADPADHGGAALRLLRGAISSFVTAGGSAEQPLPCIKSAAAGAPGLLKFRWTDLRLGGTGAPGTLAAGRFWMGPPHRWA